MPRKNVNQIANYANGPTNPGPGRITRQNPRKIPEETKSFRNVFKKSPLQERPYLPNDEFVGPLEMLEYFLSGKIFLRIWVETDEKLYRDNAWFIQANEEPDSGKRLWPGAICLTSSLLVGRGSRPESILDSIALVLALVNCEVYTPTGEYVAEGFLKRQNSREVIK